MMTPRFENIGIWARHLMRERDTTYCKRCGEFRQTDFGAFSTVRMRNGVVIRQFICQHCIVRREKQKQSSQARAAQERRKEEGGRVDAGDYDIDTAGATTPVDDAG